jgi:hypothetical protein
MVKKNPSNIKAVNENTYEGCLGRLKTDLSVSDEVISSPLMGILPLLQ